MQSLSAIYVKFSFPPQVLTPTPLSGFSSFITFSSKLSHFTPNSYSPPLIVSLIFRISQSIIFASIVMPVLSLPILLNP